VSQKSPHGGRATPRRKAAIVSLRLALCVLLASAACRAEEDRQAPTAPNLILIVLDDLDYEDLGSYGGRDIATPRLDRLAAEGVRFTQAYASSPVCSPTRAALLTGREPAALGLRQIVRRSSHRGIPARMTTLGEMLQAAGYDTAHVGKWHLGTRRPEFLPTAKGFARTVRRTPPSEGEKSLYLNYELIVDERERVPGERHLTTRLTDAALERLDALRPPFFLDLWYYAPHTPLTVPDDFDNTATRYDLSSRRGRYAAMVTHVDRQIGRVLDRLSERGLEQDTLVVVTSDNGGARHLRSGRRLRGGKSTLYEGGIRVPLIARWPAAIAEDAINESVVVSHDWLPTVAELVGLAPAFPVAGRSFAPALLAGRTLERPAPLFFEAKRAREYFEEPDARYVSYAVREGAWKLLFAADENAPATTRLFDLASDPGESTDLAGRHPEHVERLESAYRRWRRTVADVELMPVPHADGTATLGPDPTLAIHDGDFSFSIAVSPGGEDGAEATDRIVASAGSWRLSLEQGHAVLWLEDQAGEHLELRSAALDLARSHRLGFTLFQWKQGPSTVALYVDGQVVDRALRGVGPLVPGDDVIVLGDGAHSPRLALIAVEPDQIASWEARVDVH
jgi:arylsulfatase A-like enzyme